MEIKFPLIVGYQSTELFEKAEEEQALQEGKDAWQKYLLLYFDFNTGQYDKEQALVSQLNMLLSQFEEIYGTNQQPRRKRRGTVLNVSHCVFYKVVAVGFNTLCYDASVGVLNPPHE